MKRSLLEFFGAKLLYGVLCLMRLLFLSSEIGAKIHNAILYRTTLSILGPDFAEKIGRSIVHLIHEVTTKGNPAILDLERRVYLLPSSVRNRIMNDTIVWRGVFGPKRRRVLEKKGYVVPRLIYISPGDESEGKDYLSFEVLDRLIGDLEEMGTYNVSLLLNEDSFGEDLWQVVTKHPQTIFTAYTDGTFLNEAVVKRMRKLGNIGPMIDFEKASENAIKYLEFCQQENLPYGVLITVYQDNFQEVTSNTFIEWLIQKGALSVRYLPYMPSGSDDLPLRATQEQVTTLGETVDSIRRQYPIFASFGRNGETFTSSCDAARRQIHITSSGDVKPCMFVPFAIDNITDKSLLEIMESDLFRTIRGLNESGEEATINPCRWHNSPFTQTILELTAKPIQE